MDKGKMYVWSIIYCLTNHNSKSTKSQGFGSRPEKWWLKHPNGHNHRISSLVIVSVDGSNVCHMRKVVPCSSDRRLEKVFELHLTSKFSVVCDIYEVAIDLDSEIFKCCKYL